MRTFTSIEETRAACRKLKSEGKRLGLVPTMGALHAGHLSLVRAARAQCSAAAVSIFVNPAQFGPNEDFAQYPRSPDRDRELLEAEGVDLLFTPSVEEMYPDGAASYVQVDAMSERLCGRSRPGHFRGVTTVVAKLFHVFEPDLAFFGQKDAAQHAMIRRMILDLHFPVQIVICPIVREADGLALSSRNSYLSPAERKQATVLYRALSRMQTLADRGESSAATLLHAGRQVVTEEPAVHLDYVEAVNPDSLEPISSVANGALIAIAAFVGRTRLIDNVVLTGVGNARGPAQL